jgi:hypothetical protein
MTRKPKTTGFWVGRLPHWEVEDGRYFVTVHLAGAIPAEGRRRLRNLSEQASAIQEKDSPEWLSLQRAIFREMYVIMPTHLHLFGEIGNRGLKETLEDFKRWTGHRAAEILKQDGDRFWQREWFDHWSRSDEEDEKIIKYIQNNPVKARLVSNYIDWPYGSWIAYQ